MQRIENNAVVNQNQEKKEYLRGYRQHGRRIKRIESELEEIRSMKTSPSANNDGMPRGSGQSDLSGYVAQLDELEEKLYREGVEQVKAYKDISWRISQLKNEDERDVLFYRYIKGKSWWEIAGLMNCSERWVYELHGKALKNLKFTEECSSLQ